MFKKDAYWLGLLIAIILPALVFLALYFPGQFYEVVRTSSKYYKSSVLVLLSISVNFIPLRYYFVKLKFDKTGRGILLITFIMILAYFILDLEKFLDQL